MKLNLKIVKNAMPDDSMPSDPLRCVAKLAWTGAIMSDGVECDDDMLDKLLTNVKLEDYAPPLILQHDWNVKNVVGKMVDIRRIGDTLMAEFDVTDAEAQAKIKDGTWYSVSLTYEMPELKILECSLVAVPALLGAKIEPKDMAADRDAEQPAEDPVAAEEAPAEEVEVIDTVKIDENACDEDPERERENEDADDDDKRRENIVENASKRQIMKLRAENAKLVKHNKELQQVIRRNARREKCERFVTAWVQNGRTLPANKQEELDFVLTLSEAQLSMYTSLKAKGIKNAYAGRRISQPAASPEDARKDNFVAGYKKFMEAHKR